MVENLVFLLRLSFVHIFFHWLERKHLKWKHVAAFVFSIITFLMIYDCMLQLSCLALLVFILMSYDCYSLSV